jgi:hypothetical protein
MVIHKCILCNFSSTQKTAYNTHLITQKHKRNCKDSHNVVENGIINTQNNEIMITIVENQNNLAKQNNEVIKQNEELRKKIEMLEKSNQELKEVNNQNTNKIVKEARSIKKSILTILNTNFKDTPSIDYIDENMFKKELELEYKCKITDPDNKLFKRIFSDYENKKLVKTLSDIILKFVKKEDQHNQSVFNIDSSRGNYATKIENFWHNDKNGLQLKKYTLEMVVKYMINVLDKFRLQLVEIRKENIKKSNIERSDYLMKYQTLLLEVNAFLTNSNTHKKIILQMCPELRINQKLLESIKFL